MIKRKATVNGMARVGWRHLCKSMVWGIDKGNMYNVSFSFGTKK